MWILRPMDIIKFTPEIDGDCFLKKLNLEGKKSPSLSFEHNGKTSIKLQCMIAISLLNILLQLNLSSNGIKNNSYELKMFLFSIVGP